MVSEGQFGPGLHQDPDVGLVTMFRRHVEWSSSLASGTARGVQVGSGLQKRFLTSPSENDVKGNIFRKVFFCVLTKCI